MSAKRVLLIVLVASAVMLAVGIGPRVAGSAYALPPMQEPEPTGVTIPYPGRLSDDAGQPVADGAYDFTFALYEAETGGRPLWSEVQEGVAVEGGAFVAPLGSVNPIPAAVLDGGARWLAVGVRGAGETDFTALTPRQRLSAASPAAPAGATAGGACPHDHFAENWVGSNPTYALRIENTGTGDGIQGWAVDNVRSGVYGRHTAGGYGVFGRSTSGYGGGFTSANDHYDLFLGGAVGRINANEQPGSELYLSSNADVIVKLDNDGGGNNVFHVWSSGGADLFTVSENGYAGFFTAASDHNDLALGGAVGRINTDPNNLNSDLYLSSNGDVTIKLDNDSGGGGADILYFRSRGHEIGRMDDAGNLTIIGNMAKAGGGFKIDHPLDPESQYLNHSFVESPDMMNVYNGNVTLDANGEAWVELPEWFEALNQDFRYQLTCIGGFAPVYIAQEIQNNRFHIAGGTPGLKVSWQVTGIRHDPFAEAHRIPVEEEKPPEEQGTYVHPIEYGKPETLGRPGGGGDQ